MPEPHRRHLRHHRRRPLGPLVLVRHGQSTANAEGRFTGWVDVPLTRHGEAEAVAAAGLLGAAGLLPDVVHTSVMVRSIRSADLMLAALDRMWIPVRRTWRLNERQYGALTERDKREVRAEAGGERYRVWRRSMHGRPAPLPPAELARLRADPRYAALRPDGVPAVESLADMAARVAPYWADVLAPQLREGRTVLVVAHGNALRALCLILDRLTDPEAARLDIPTAAPLRYDFTAELRPLTRGGVYLDPDTARARAALVAAEGRR
ncbi:2,3-bisphosphoglycerate-dependent phosphoglycerate mutase [Streptomyces antibioticus]|uniref:2,3-bisphosphoglycerate-dependent phosphoglycerate mutase n=1 Tax=Streptomyces antibioticus TaxID=1890 RepID=UPI00225BCC6A|nr:2,3-bisphosphoglycerate-dependent phosphoglycerate mutase [Streptomyces antibioticus]MCX5173506.1 2,3-bisphosphoglycerate-dependent phosphoglycerate mutase [Streptomyces antibioticus]